MAGEGVEGMESASSRTRHLRVETSVGGVAVLDYGGSGVDTLMFHTPGFCADSLSLAAVEMTSRCRVYSVELPGHGHSPTDGMRAADFWPAIPQIVEGLGLTRPLLVGFELSGFMTVAAVVNQPELAAGVVAVGAWCLRTPAENAEFLELITAEDVMANVADRMLLGARASDEEGMRAIMLTLARNSIHDFLIEDEEARFADKIACTVRRLDDGTFVRLPTVETMRRMYDLSAEDAAYPGPALLEAVTIPCTLMLTADGVDGEFIARADELAARRGNVDVVVLQAGNNPQMSHPREVGAALVKAATRIG